MYTIYVYTDLYTIYVPNHLFVASPFMLLMRRMPCGCLSLGPGTCLPWRLRCLLFRYPSYEYFPRSRTYNTHADICRRGLTPFLLYIKSLSHLSFNLRKYFEFPIFISTARVFKLQYNRV